MRWRVNYIKGPRAKGRTIRHYVFLDHRYQFTFRDVKDPQPVRFFYFFESQLNFYSNLFKFSTLVSDFLFSNCLQVMSTALGSLSGDTNCVVDFSWHYPGTGPFRADETMKDRLQEGYDSLQKSSEPVRYGRRAFAYHKKFWNQGFCGPNKDPVLAREVN